MKTKLFIISALSLLLIYSSCKKKEKNTELKAKTEQFAEFELNSDLSILDDSQKEMISIFIEVADIMDDIYWREAYGDKNELLSKYEDDYTKQFIKINYGPWERLNGNKSFLADFKEKPAGANFYPADMTKEEFKAFEDTLKDNLYTFIRRDENGRLKTVWYHQEFKPEIEKAAALLKKAATLAKDSSLNLYLNLRAEALLTDKYYESDLAWMDMRSNLIDFVVGPIENYEDALFNYKAAHEAYVLVKDVNWSEKLIKYAAMLPEMQKSLPVPDQYKAEVPGTNSELAVYDVIYYAGDCNAGSKTIAINLPNDSKVQLLKGSRRLQLKNAMQAKFEKILVPIGNVLIDESQRKHIVYNAFFENTMFHETAHGLGIKNLINDTTMSVDKALGELSTTIEEGKADILGLYFVTKLYEMGEFPEKDLMDNYVTFMAGIFRSVRFGVSSSHGKANMLRFYYFKDAGAFTKDKKTGTYKVDFEKMKQAMISLTNKILIIQGDGNYAEAKKWVDEKSIIDADLQADLDKVNSAGIPVDIVFKQGKSVLKLK